MDENENLWRARVPGDDEDGFQNRNNTHTPGGFSHVWQIKDLWRGVFGSVAMVELMK